MRLAAQEISDSQKQVYFGPRGSDTVNLMEMMPLQEDPDHSSDRESKNHEGSFDTVPLRVETQQKDMVNHLAFLEQSKTKVQKFENQLSYLKSLLSLGCDEEKLQFTSELLMRHFVKTPRLSSTGKFSSFFTDFAGKTTTQFGSNKFTSPTVQDSEDGKFWSSRRDESR